MLGCDENHTPEELELLRVFDVSVREGAKIATNQNITVTFNKKMESVEISITCAAGNTVLDSNGRKATWISLPYSPPGFETLPWALWDGIPPGPHTLTVTGTDVFGQELQGFAPINFIVLGPDCHAPGIADDKCDPKPDSTVDPQKYPNKLTIVFDGEAGNRVTNIKVVNTRPRFPFTEELSPDGLTFTIWLLDGYMMPYNTKFDIMFVGKSGCLPMHGFSPTDCQPVPVNYSFKTMAKVEK
jgi:hypothetical protein